MSTTLTRPLRAAPVVAIPANLAAVCLFTLLGLMLSLVVLPHVSSETIATMASMVG
jgi:hypothetical protein